MELLYTHEHLSCKNFERNCASSAVELIRLNEGEAKELQLSEAEIVFIIKGHIIISYETVEAMRIECNNILFFPPGSRILVTSDEDSKILVCRFRDSIKLCDAYTPDDLSSEFEAINRKICPLPFNKRIDAYLESFVPCLKEGLRCSFFIDIKIKEVFFLLRAYYTKKELFDFFNPLLSADIKFSSFIWKNYRRVGSVKEFACLANYSVSRFNDKFKEVFGVSALNWLNHQKSRNLYYELRFTDKSFEEISDEFHFASSSYLSTFCKQYLSQSPKDIRFHGTKQSNNS